MEKYNLQKITKVYSLTAALILVFSLFFIATDIGFSWYQQNWLTFLCFSLYLLTIVSFFIITIIYACHQKLMYTNSEIPEKFNIKKYVIVSAIASATIVGLAIVITPIVMIYIIDHWFFVFQVFLFEIGLAIFIFLFVLLYFYILYILIRKKQAKSAEKIEN